MTKRHIGSATITLFLLTYCLFACGSTQSDVLAKRELSSTTVGFSSTTTSSTTPIVPTTFSSDLFQESFTEVFNVLGPLGALNELQLGCLADELLIRVPFEVALSISANGPRPEEAASTVDALFACGAIEVVFQEEIATSMTDHNDLLFIDPSCLLSGVSVEHMLELLKLQFSQSGALSVYQPEMESLLFDTPIMTNLLRCTLEINGHLSLFCDGFIDHFDGLMRLILHHDTLGETFDPVAYAELFSATEEVFAWLATNVEKPMKNDAILVHDGVIVVSDSLHEAVERMQESDPILRDTTMLAASTRIAAGLESIKLPNLVSAAAHLRKHLNNHCGEQTTIIFDLFLGFGFGFISED